MPPRLPSAPLPSPPSRPPMLARAPSPPRWARIWCRTSGDRPVESAAPATVSPGSACAALNAAIAWATCSGERPIFSARLVRIGVSPIWPRMPSNRPIICLLRASVRAGWEHSRR
ncbi:hypothetical protein WR25_23679 [Diploscapter pachys]|uniref:Uncharacterized protein n=1 Tax=Diploscapter pachys TaxID=2018661 RepID=A0A2A2M4T4_9BILA|nr:hypothetical protein WR25_23679 [Diploscapter pachys]